MRNVGYLKRRRSKPVIIFDKKTVTLFKGEVTPAE
jgi:hypothetical protein